MELKSSDEVGGTNPAYTMKANEDMSDLRFFFLLVLIGIWILLDDVYLWMKKWEAKVIEMGG